MSRRLRHGGSLLLVALLSLMLAACSTLQLGYNQADMLLAWRADNYFDFDPPQKHEFNLRLNRLLAWHRREQLPDYAQFVHTAVERARSGLDRDDIHWLVDGAKKRYRSIVDRGIGDAAELLGMLSNEQLQALPKQFAKDNRRFIDEHDLDANAERRQRTRLKRTLSQISDWTGSLSRAQEQRIEQLLAAVPAIEPLRHQDRLRRQREFIELLKLRTQRGQFQPALHAWLLDWEAGRSAEFARLSAEVYERRVDFYIAVEKLLTPAQREHALKRLHGFGDDFKALSERPLAAMPAATIATLALAHDLAQNSVFH